MLPGISQALRTQSEGAISEAHSQEEEPSGGGEDEEDEEDGQAREKSVGLGEGDLVSDSYLEIKPLLEPGEVIVSVMDCRRVQVNAARRPGRKWARGCKKESWVCGRGG